MISKGPKYTVYQPHPMGFRPAGKQSRSRPPSGIRSRRSRCSRPPAAVRPPRRNPAALLRIAPFPAVVIALILINTGAFDKLLLGPKPAPAAVFPSEPSPPLTPPVPVHKASLETPGSRPSIPQAVFTYHKVHKGETLSRIAYQYGLTPFTLISVNRLKASRDITPGRRLIVPYRDGERLRAHPHENAAEASARIGASPDSLQILPGGDFFIPGARSTPVPPENLSDSMFLHPVTGPVITPFGSGLDNLTGIPYDSEGIEVAVERGSPVLAAREGTVILTGSHPSYGLYVIMSHAERWRSFYGHLNRVDTAPGDRLAAGDRLGISGDSGIARSPRLLFVLIRNGQLVDPLDYL